MRCERRTCSNAPGEVHGHLLVLKRYCEQRSKPAEVAADAMLASYQVSPAMSERSQLSILLVIETHNKVTWKSPRPLSLLDL